jgi:hypothetical protein
VAVLPGFDGATLLANAVDRPLASSAGPGIGPILIAVAIAAGLGLFAIGVLRRRR